ncbi:5455_t:CDS:2 [Entrophospora sp. SA101]|nr:5455_t:CDS:2 [Entrophospora sp. SA101]
MTEFQGITFEKWFEFFIQFMIMATKNGHGSEAYDVVMLRQNSQKYLLRQIKAMDSGISDSSPTKPDAGLLTLYGHILGCSRSYNGALGYYAQAALVKPKDPLVCFSMGLAYLHRAMQRKTRHAFHQLGLAHLAIPHYEKALKLPSVNQILKQKIDKKKQLETDENEVENFEENDPTDIRKEAVYDLYLNYMETGSSALAQMLLKKYYAI